MPCDHDHPDDHHAGHHHAHSHGFTPERFDRAMAIGVALNALFVGAEIAAGVAGGSLALLADAGHNAGDVVGLLLAWGASRLARRPPTPRYTWGLRRSTIYAALTNAVLLLTACGGILLEAVHRLRDPVEVAGPLVVIVAGIGVVINTVTALLFFRGAGGDANVRGAFLHMAADAAISAGVVIAGIVIAVTGQAWIDPLVGIAITVAIIAGTWGLFRESVDLALDAVPRGLDPAAVTDLLAAIPGVTEVHDLHVWNASTSEISLTVHLVVPDSDSHERVLARATDDLRGRFHVDHTTIQLEREDAGRTCTQRPAETL